MTDLPIHEVLPDLVDALARSNSAVLIAPPGAGKTTAVAPALLNQAWCDGMIILLSPRRVAARAAAERIAELLGENAGGRAGYLTRLDSRRSPATRILVVTEAIFVSMILSDAELSGVSAVLFDEAHERHLDSELGLALARECQQVLRPDLRILVMSATIDGMRFAALLGNNAGSAPLIESAGRAHPLAIRWLGAHPELRLEDSVATAVVTAWREGPGDILVFLPGVREIERTAERLAERLPQAVVLPLHGQVEPSAQRAAIRRDPAGRRRIVLATSIAETSLTLDGVTIVVDAGLSRRAEFDAAAGVTRLVTHRASRASSDQRAGRAARQGSGTAYRLWEKASHAGRPAFDPPEIETSDLAPLVLALAQWGSGDPAELTWLDPPPQAMVGVARSELAGIGALDNDGRITTHGRAMAQLPMEPAVAHMLLFAARHGVSETGARLALLLQERGLGGRDVDLAHRLDRWDRDRSRRAEESRKLAARWSKSAALISPPANGTREPPLAVLLAEAFPGRIARRRRAGGEEWLAASGRAYRLDSAEVPGQADWLVIADAQGQANGARITASVVLDEGDISVWLQHRVIVRHQLRWRDESEAVEPVRERLLGAISLSRGFDPDADRDAIAAMLLDNFARRGLAAFPLSEASQALLARAKFAGVEALLGEGLIASASDWLGPLIEDERSLRAIPQTRLHQALLERLDWNERQALDRLAPPEFVSPAGTRHPIDYAGEGGPAVEVRVQALFGLDSHPTFGEPPSPLLLRLTSPAGRPLQSTRDLPGFWRGTWRDVQRDMKGRYPRHRWPDEPWREDPSLKTRNAFERSRGN